MDDPKKEVLAGSATDPSQRGTTVQQGRRNDTLVTYAEPPPARQWGVYPYPPPPGYGGYGAYGYYGGGGGGGGGGATHTRRREHTRTYRDPADPNVGHKTTTSTSSSVGYGNSTGGGYWGDDWWGYWWVFILFFVLLFIGLIVWLVIWGGGSNNTFCDTVEDCATIQDILARLTALEP